MNAQRLPRIPQRVAARISTWVSAWIRARIPARVAGRSRPAPLRVERLWRARAAGEAMQACRTIVVDADGIVGDRYRDRRGHWKLGEACVLTVIERRVAERGEREGRAPGWHRRNIEISGLDLDGRRVRRLRALRLTAGEGDSAVTLQLERPRPPCGWLDQVSGRGAARALGWDAGWCLRIEHGGRIEAGAALAVRRATPPERD